MPVEGEENGADWWKRNDDSSFFGEISSNKILQIIASLEIKEVGSMQNQS